ncbi:PilW family protein [Microbulbifer epialgicus]|uniref:PilW family protein n=1 Tax=Microbulbifer epialgicus TaxID=393907 RepID=A0ABV4NWK1_9GAMM
MYTFASQRGLSLIELMIGILLGSILLLGVLQIFQSNSDTLRMQNGFSRVQESGRFAVDMLSKEVRQAGFWGCAEAGNIKNSLGAPTTNFLSEIGTVIGVAGKNDVPTGAIVGEKEVVAKSDVLTLSGAEDACAGEGRMLNGTNPGDVIVSTSCPIDTKDNVIVSNCIAGHAFTVTGTSAVADGKKINYGAGINFEEDYGADSKILTPYQKTFFIAKSVSGSNSLFVHVEGDDKAQELIPGIEDMQISYGEDKMNDGIIDYWRSASSVNSMASVTAIKIELIVTSDSAAGVGAQTITRLDGTKKDYNDGLLRKLYVATVKVRNRGSM